MRALANQQQQNAKILRAAQSPACLEIEYLVVGSLAHRHRMRFHRCLFRLMLCPLQSDRLDVMDKNAERATDRRRKQIRGDESRWRRSLEAVSKPSQAAGPLRARNLQGGWGGHTITMFRNCSTKRGMATGAQGQVSRLVASLRGQLEGGRICNSRRPTLSCSPASFPPSDSRSWTGGPWRCDDGRVQGRMWCGT